MLEAALGRILSYIVPLHNLYLNCLSWCYSALSFCVIEVNVEQGVSLPNLCMNASSPPS